MKKSMWLFLSVCILLALVVYCRSPRPRIHRITLNGFYYKDINDEATQAVNQFKSNNVRKPIMTSIWFDRKMINNMVNLLHSETPHNTVCDGIRFYYARNKQGQNTIILVSTYPNGTYSESNGVDPPVTKTVHQDYFEHDISKNLFANATSSDPHVNYSLNGEVCSNNSCDNSARLYQNFKNCNEDIGCNASLPHFLSMEESHERVWNFGVGLINTKSEWFDLKMFEAFLTTKANGLRVYFGRHLPSDGRYPNADGFVLVTTRDSIINRKRIKRCDYFDCQGIQSYFIEIKRKHPRLLFDAEDQGEQCQPSCNGTTSF